MSSEETDVTEGTQRVRSTRLAKRLGQFELVPDTPAPVNRIKRLGVTPEEVIYADLETLNQKILELGATETKLITTDQIVFDSRTRLKCRVPMCPHYGQSLNCPPAIKESLEEIKERLTRYKYAILFRQSVEPAQFAGTGALDKHTHVESSRQIYRIAAKAEAAAFYLGYYLAASFGGGPCRSWACEGRKCAGVQPGGGCVYPMIARSSFSAGLGVDALATVDNVGWPAYAIGRAHEAEDVPDDCAYRLGCLFVV